MLNITPYYDFAVRIASKAGKILLDRYQTDFRIDFKDSDKGNLVTEVDRLSENCIVEAIREKYPDHAILTEESGILGKEKSDFRWIIDPLDGTVNYAHGLPFFCVSIALEFQGEVIVGVVYAPQLDEFFRCAKGHGTFLNNRVTRVSKVKSLESSMLATGFSYQKKEENLPLFEKFLQNSQCIRRLGSAALDLAYISTGRLDGFWELRLKPWDIAAGKLLVQEAGGRVTAIDGSPLILHNQNILASNGFIHGEMLKTLGISVNKKNQKKNLGKRKVPFWS